MNNELFIKMITDSWQQQINATNKIFDNLSDAELMQEVSAGRNRGIYLLGHLTSGTLNFWKVQFQPPNSGVGSPNFPKVVYHIPETF